MATPGASSRHAESHGSPRHGHDRSTSCYDNDDRGDGGGRSSRWPRLPNLDIRIQRFFSARYMLSEQEVDEDEFLHMIVTFEEVKDVIRQAQESLARIVDLMRTNDWDKYYTDSIRGSWASASIRYKLLRQLAGELNSGPNLMTACLGMNSVAVSTGMRKEVMPPEAYKAARKLLWALNEIESQPDNFTPVSASAASPAPEDDVEDNVGGDNDDEGDDNAEKRNREKRDAVWARLSKAFDEFSSACQKTVDEAEKVNKVYVKVLGKRGWIAVGLVFGVIGWILGAITTHDWQVFFDGRTGWSQPGTDPSRDGEPDHYGDDQSARREDELDQLEYFERLDLGADKRVYDEGSQFRSRSRSPSRRLLPQTHHDSSYFTTGEQSSLRPAPDGYDSREYTARPHQWAERAEQPGRFLEVPPTHGAGLTPTREMRARARYEQRYPSSTSSSSNAGNSHSSNYHHPSAQHYHQNRAHSQPDSVRGSSHDDDYNDYDDDDDDDGYHTPRRTQQQEQYDHMNHRSTRSPPRIQGAPQTIYDIELHTDYDAYPTSPPFSPTSPSTRYTHQGDAILGVIEDEDLVTRSRKASDAALGAYQAAEDAAACSTRTQWGGSPTKF